MNCNKGGFIVKNYCVSFKQDNMLCHRCLTNVVKTLSSVDGIEELNVSLETKKIKLIYNDADITKERLKELVNKAILSGKAQVAREKLTVQAMTSVNIDKLKFAALRAPQKVSD